jgi:hypothetical protein
VLNVTGPERVSVREVAHFFARRFSREARFAGEPAGPCLLGDAGRCVARLGAPQVGLDTLLEWCADWVAAGGRSLGKPTRYERSDGRF